MARILMGSRQDLALWRSAWAKPGSFKLSLEDFNTAMANGVSPWYFPPSPDPKTLVGALCRDHHCDLAPMLSAWIKHAGDLCHPPVGHPSVLCCLPLDASISAVDKLIAGGADASGPLPSVALFRKALEEPLAFEDGGFWQLAERLMGAAGVRLAQLANPLGHGEDSLFQAIVQHPLSGDGNQALLRGGWALDWARNDEAGKSMRDWICMVVLIGDVAPSALTHAGVRWSDRSVDGNTLAHWLVINPHYSHTGNPVLPVDGLIEAVEQGLSLAEDNAQGWNVVQRINAVRWQNEGEAEKLFSLIRARKLDAATPSAVPRGSVPRL